MTRYKALALTSALIAGMAAASTAASAQTETDTISRISAFFQGADLRGAPEIVDCTLSGGARTRCVLITLKAEPKGYTPGPWCPGNISDGAEAGGIWLKDGEVHDVDGSFIKNLAELYGDTEWQLYDPDTGDIRFTGTLQACEAAARPDVDPAYQNYCVQCLPEYMPENATVTFVIPLEPQPAGRPQPTHFSGSGIAYNGIRLDGPAPLDAILAAHTIAPFDDCGGHVNTHVGYHYHAVTDCLKQAPATFGPVPAEHGTQIGIAMDGYQIFPHLMVAGTEPDDLDSCNGHESEDGSYHYHAGAAGSNAILGCLTAQAGCVFEAGTATCDASKPPPRP
ncbi:YHYH protein [Hoeflea ulvae]|uniref:YHYH protein n=1 Tax=Hoeflea ulvae TaxID=2983764 RepID=A0ABT3YJL0_9HYPH|nr:YHYH protein [Hoeflea ulvae]MCY0095969.1 YHYH protein [Hoeflea ulvae]